MSLLHKIEVIVKQLLGTAIAQKPHHVHASRTLSDLIIPQHFTTYSPESLVAVCPPQVALSPVVVSVATVHVWLVQGALSVTRGAQLPAVTH